MTAAVAAWFWLLFAFIAIAFDFDGESVNSALVLSGVWFAADHVVRKLRRMTPETRADIFKRGYVTDRKTNRVVHSPYAHEEHELFFDVKRYEKDINHD